MRNAILFAIFLLLPFIPASAQTLNVLHNFGVTFGDGNIPYATPIMDGAGNLYGTTLSGGAHGLGSVYRLTPTSGGGWEETTLYSFAGIPDGASPHAQLLRDSAGNLYGTTIQGGVTAKHCNSSAPARGCGVIFKLTPAAQGEWTETLLYTFTGGNDGGNPYARLIRDHAGDFYGTTTVGGSANHGVIFELSPTASGWQQTVLHTFSGANDGNSPYAPVIFDRHGNLYGTTYEGGETGLGIVYRLSPHPSGAWTEQILHTFAGQTGNDGAETFSGVVLDAAGNLYGTTFSGGEFNYGAVFELVAEKGFASKLLHSFQLNGVDGTFPNGVIFDAVGNLWGTTQGAGALDGAGTVFKMTPGPNGWTESVLYTFEGSAQGVYPDVSPLIDPAGRIYGTTIWGGTLGSTNGGVTFQFVP